MKLRVVTIRRGVDFSWIDFTPEPKENAEDFLKRIYELCFENKIEYDRFGLILFKEGEEGGLNETQSHR